MPSISVSFELEHTNSGPRTVPANSTQEFSFPAPAGRVALSWGIANSHPTLVLQTAAITSDENGQRFVAIVQNTSGVDRSIRFTFVLLKV